MWYCRHLIILFLLFSCSDRVMVKRTRMMMGTVVEISVVSNDRPRGRRAAEQAFSAMEEVEKGLWHIDAGQTLPPESLALLSQAVRVSDLSSGAFDPTVRPLVRIWASAREKGTLPSRDRIASALGSVDYRGIILEGDRVRFRSPLMSADLSGIAKGYAVKRAVRSLRDAGIEHALVNAGGDLFAMGTVNGRKWRIGIQDPRRKDGIIGIIEVSGVSVMTSGDYEKFFISDGKRYHHILDPSTGYPAQGCRSSTVVCPDPVMADALATAVFVMGPEKGMALIETLEDTECVIVDGSGELTVSSGLEGKFLEVTEE